MTVFKHRGLEEANPDWRFVSLPKLKRDQATTQVEISLADANQIDLGYILALSGEQVCIEAIYVGSHCPPFKVLLRRGFNGTAAVAHPASRWPIVAAPVVDFRSAEEKARDRALAAAEEYLPKHWWVGRIMQKCPVCGAPDQECGERCRYCGIMMPDPQP